MPGTDDLQQSTGQGQVARQGPGHPGAGYLEPWMRGTHTELDPLRRAVVHALELTLDDVERHCRDAAELLFLEAAGLPTLAFHLRHIVRSLDRLLTYAEGRLLDADQTAALATERESGEAAQVLAEFRSGMGRAIERVQRFSPEQYGEPRGIGRKQLPTTVAGLLIHCGEHTQRHAGQAVMTCKVVRSGKLEAS